MHKVIIIEDEPLARKVVRDYLSGFNDMEIVAECANGFEGLKSITQFTPDLVFLDIQMPKITGFEMLELIDDPPSIIFTTAYDEFAIRAFEANAIDYLLKPFTKERFEKAVMKWKELKTSGVSSVKSDLHSLKEPLSEQPFKNRIVVKSGQNIKIIPVDEVHYIQAYDDYIKIHITGDCFLKKQTMQQTEQQFDGKKFIRVHRSYIVNVNEISRIEPLNKETQVAVLRDQTRIPLSKSGYQTLKLYLGI